MFRPLELFIGIRYIRAKRRNHFISFISVVSMLGLIIGITALITVISVMNGFDFELRSRILGMVSQASITSVGNSMSNWQQALAIAERNPHVEGAAPYVEREAYLSGNAASQGAIVRGILPDQEPKVADIGSKMIAGNLSALTPGSWGIVLGRDLALTLGVNVGDKLVLTASIGASPIGALPRLRRFTVVGIFEAGMQEYDSGLAIVNMHDAEKLYQMSGPSGIRLKLDDLFVANKVATTLADKLGDAYRVQGWMQQHANFFKAIAMEKIVMFIILSLIVAVAAFNLVSSLVMLVTDKQSDIAILRTLGATPRSIMGVFMIQGMLIGLMGILIGTVCGVALAINVPAIVDGIQNLTGYQFLPESVYYINNVPSKLEWSNVGWITGMAFVFSLLATIYPAWRASRTQPAEALRYE
ncbi:MAG: lipoprotein-releasing ABC transporter permease subunit [Xanthomonadales bacterium]|nr:lipoprotein-releasing ABC transporter permease subunit [Xanthomonadales bacterium]ODU94142.1 MAG: cell division protein FtsX [Rhodanobacter sp. SCN 66-43]OJY84024.1 MAG: cell division protein FtsX [Xanthomonadales bacterium 66-474]